MGVFEQLVAGGTPGKKGRGTHKPNWTPHIRAQRPIGLRGSRVRAGAMKERLTTYAIGNKRKND